MNIGRLRERVTLYARTVTNNGGAAVPSDTVRTPERVPAGVESVTGERLERLFGSQVQPIATHLVTMRAWDDVRLSDRLVWHTGAGDRTLEVRGKQLVDVTRRVMVLACEERDANP